MDSRAEERWYVLRTAPGNEREASGLLERAVDRRLFTDCRILRKAKVFRSGGQLHRLEEPMFPGYLFIRTAYPEDLADELARARAFPQMVGKVSASKVIRRKTGRPAAAAALARISGDISAEMIPVEETDLDFLKNVCGENLQKMMGISKITLDGDRRIVSAEGVLRQYLDRIVKLNLRKRCAIVEVELFNRRQEVLFGVWLEKDRVG